MGTNWNGHLRRKNVLKEKMKKQKIQISFLGSGNMAESIIKGILDAKLHQPETLLACDISEERLKYLQNTFRINTTRSNREAVREGQVIVLAVKPKIVNSVLAEIRSELGRKLLVSVAAGVPTSRLNSQLEREAQIIRAMPNAPSKVQNGATVIAAGKGVDEKHLKSGLEIFNSIGKTWILEENHLDVVTGLSGSGPAFVFVMIEALADGAVKEGLPRKIALSLAAQTVLGAAQMCLQTGEHPAVLKDFVASPGGTTMSGLHLLESGNIRFAFMEAVGAATKKSRELGKE